MNYEQVTMIVTAAEAEDLNLLLNESGIEGCVNIFGPACWPDGTELIYLPSGAVDLAKSPPATHYMASGWLHNDAIALLPEQTLVEKQEVTP